MLYAPYKLDIQHEHYRVDRERELQRLEAYQVKTSPDVLAVGVWFKASFKAGRYV